MSAFQNITVFDGAGASHTLTAVEITRGGKKLESLWRELITTIPTEAQISVRMSIEKLPSGTFVQTMDVQVPIMESIAGQNASGYTAAPKVAYIDRQVVTTYSHPRSTVAGRRLLRQLSINMQGNIGTNVISAVTGPYPELVDLQVMPS